ncbi:MAG: hypothetical protein AAF485_25885 [Chloroflexota bacterium]
MDDEQKEGTMGDYTPEESPQGGDQPTAFDNSNVDTNTPASPNEEGQRRPVSQQESLDLSGAERKAGSSSGGNPVVLGLIIALVFLLGLGIGFLGRPALIDDIPIEVVVTVLPNPTQAVAQASEPTATPAAESSDEARAGSQDTQNNDQGGSGEPTIMDLIMSDARHTQGSDDAVVTLVEFSDFN